MNADQKLQAALKDAIAAEGKYVIVRKFNQRYLSSGPRATGWATKLSSAKLFESLGEAIGTARIHGRGHRVNVIDAGGMLGAKIWG